jgi:hypothetical protein
MVYRFMSVRRGEERRGWGTDGVDSPDTRVASLSVWQPPDEGSPAPGLREAAGKPQESGPIDAGKGP